MPATTTPEGPSSPSLPLSSPLASSTLSTSTPAPLQATPSPPAKSPELRGVADVTAPGPRRLWHDTIAAMARQPGSVPEDLRRIHDWITDGITLDLESLPTAAEHSNTLSVLRNADVVRARLREYMEFGAVVQLAPDHPCPFGVQPLHVIIKEGKKPRVVIDLSRNLNSHLEYKYFSYSSVGDATELSTPGCWYGKLDLSNCFLSFPLHPSARPHFIFRFEEQLYQFTRMPFGLSSAPRICTMLLSVVAFRLTAVIPASLIRYLDDFLFIAMTRDAMDTTLRLSTTDVLRLRS